MSAISPQETGDRIIRLVRTMALLSFFFLVSAGAYTGWNAWQLREKRERWFQEQRHLLGTVLSNSGFINNGYDDFMRILLWYHPQSLEGLWLNNLSETLSFLQTHSPDGDVQQTVAEAKKTLARIGILRRESIAWGKRYRELRDDFEAEQSLEKVRGISRDFRDALDALQGERALETATPQFRHRRGSGKKAHIPANKMVKINLDDKATYFTSIATELAEWNYRIEHLSSEYNADALVDMKDNILKSILARLGKAVQLAFEDEPEHAMGFERRLSDLATALFGEGYKIDEALQTIHLGGGGLFALRKEFIRLTYQRDTILISVDEEFNRFKLHNDQIMSTFSEMFEDIIRNDQAAMQRLWYHLLIAGSIFLGLFLFFGWQVSMEAARQVTALHAGREHLRSIMNSMLDGLITIDDKGRVESYNPAAKELFSLSQEKLIGDQVDVLIPDLGFPMKDSPGYAPRFRQEATGRRPDGTRFPVELSLTQIPMAPQPLYSVIIRDITDQKLFEDRLRQMAIHDPLTGLYNRGEGMRVLEEEIKRADRYHRPLSVVMLDIDHFKRINDTYGHGVGDNVLCSTAKQLEELVRTSDTVARYGGEEMLIVLPETDLPAARQLAERLREGVAAQRVPQISGEPISVTASLGVATYPLTGDNMESVLAAADQTLYKAKAEGRNRVCG